LNIHVFYLDLYYFVHSSSPDIQIIVLSLLRVASATHCHKSFGFAILNVISSKPLAVENKKLGIANLGALMHTN
jgi:hypothetical protein